MPDPIETTNWIIIPVTIRPDVVAFVQLPKALSQAEAEKIARVVMAYAD